MIRLWNRVGVFRTLSLFVLVLGVVSGLLMGSGRQTQQRINSSAQVSQSEADELRELRQDLADRQRASAASRAAQREAQAKADAAAAAAAAQAKAADDAQRKSAGSKPAGPAAPPNFGPIPTSCDEYKSHAPNGQNKAIGCALVLQAGYPISEMACLEPMWSKESGWNPLARNSGSGSYGIPQALPASKMSAYGSDYLTNPATQIKWGLAYIRDRYKSPCGAWSYWQGHGWY